MHLAGSYLDFIVLVPPLFEQEIVQIRQGQQEPIPIRAAGTDKKALPAISIHFRPISANSFRLFHATST